MQLKQCSKCGANLTSSQCDFCRFVDPSFELHALKKDESKLQAKNDIERAANDRRSVLQKLEGEIKLELAMLKNAQKKYYVRVIIGIFLILGSSGAWPHGAIPFIATIVGGLALVYFGGKAIKNGLDQKNKLLAQLRETESERRSLLSTNL